MRQSNPESNHFTAAPPAAGGPELCPPSGDAQASVSVREQVVIVDGDGETCRRLGSLLERHGMSTRCFDRGEPVLAARFGPEVACLVIEVELPDFDGIELLERLNQQGRPVPAIVLAAGGHVPTAVRAIRAKAVDFFEKPVIENLLLKCIRQVMAHERRNE